MLPIEYINTGRRNKQCKLVYTVLYDICDAERQKKCAYDCCDKTSYIAAKKKLRIIAQYLKNCGLEIEMSRVYESCYLYNIARKALMSQEV